MPHPGTRGGVTTQDTELPAPVWLCCFLLPNLGIQVQEGTQGRALSSKQLQSRALAQATRRPPHSHTALAHTDQTYWKDEMFAECFEHRLPNAAQAGAGTHQSPACQKRVKTPCKAQNPLSGMLVIQSLPHCKLTHSESSCLVTGYPAHFVCSPAMTCNSAYCIKMWCSSSRKK